MRFKQAEMQIILKFSTHFIFSLAATNIRYQITGGNIGNAFAVQNTTGVIYVASPLDYETRPKVSRLFHPPVCLHVSELLTGATQN